MPNNYNDSGEFAASLGLRQEGFLEDKMNEFVQIADHNLKLYQETKEKTHFELCKKYFYHAMTINYLINSYNNDQYEKFYHKYCDFIEGEIKSNG